MTTFTADAADTHFIATADLTYAYRRLGSATGVPLVMANRFRGTIDHWDPALLDRLSYERDVIIFDNTGVNLSTGQVPNTIGGMADQLLQFVDALHLSEFDLLGWSMGGMVALSAVLKRPDLCRRVVIAASSPGPVPGTPERLATAAKVAGKPVNDDEDFLFLFFPQNDAARAVGLASLRRLDTRLSKSHAAVSAAGVACQQAATRRWSRNEDAAWDHLSEIDLPVLVANGAHDVMIPAYETYAMTQRLPRAKAVIYSDAGHAFLFQHPADFAVEVLEFLAAADPLSPHAGGQPPPER
jgi:pimeloyl-ACP methyl ester carboxylesterase